MSIEFSSIECITFVTIITKILNNSSYCLKLVSVFTGVFDAQPTATERQRENLSLRLRREFGLALPDDEETRPPTENTGMATWRHNNLMGYGGASLRHCTGLPDAQSGRYDTAKNRGPPRLTPATSNCEEDQWNINMYSTAYGYKTGVKGLKWGRRG